MSEQLTNEELIQVAREFGTPVYVYNADKIEQQYHKLRGAFGSERVKIFYAAKALTNLSVLRFIKKLGANVDCSSINEVKLALQAGFEPSRILYTSNGIHFTEIEEALQLGVFVNIDSLFNLQKLGAQYGNKYPVGVRLRPNIMAGGNLKISTGHDKSKFGIPVEQLDQLLEIVKKYNIRIRNLHIHTGSDIKDAAVFVKGIEVLFDIIPHFPYLQSVDLGGGFKVAYKEGDPVIDVEALAQKVLTEFDAHETARRLEIWFEPGKFMVSEAGYLITSVNLIKETSATTFVSVNSGFNHLIRPMFYDAYHRISNITNPSGPVKAYSVVGNICETDTFAWERPLPEVREGDLLVFYNAGAYGYEMASTFNSRFRPAEVIVYKGNAQLIRKRDTLDDLTRNQVVVDL
ncbi:diaminopimelate decarboxylase [Niabella ginsenosidivorans]|uniref:Diaminopimelate decarboxylase n=1 Tax=Niabella ginsenosidivorans TaxID=1176587 RepID=A0A1A9I645_9BACT|nr:diaminopimelate decarboxylase [Niabella ginsenosidivorans]ANH82180.1 diaminopimelate decarboxylase [Niabella ginsenosidivorans]